MPVDSVTYPSGNSYNRRNFDPIANPRGLANGGTDTLWMDMCQDQIDVAAAAIEAAAAAETAAAEAQAFGLTSTTSASVLTIGAGPQTVVMADPLPLIPGTWVTVSSSASPTNFMTGLVASRVGTTLNITVPAGLAAAIGGAGTFNAWRIQSCGAPGATGGVGPAWWNVTAVKTAAYTAASGEMVPVNTAGGAVVISLPPTPAAGARVRVLRLAGGANTVVIGRNGSTINGVASDLTIALDGADVILFYTGATWSCSYAGLQALEPQIGDVLVTSRAPGAKWVRCGQVYLQASYPALFGVVGLVGTSPTSWSTVNDSTYASSTVYGAVKSGTNWVFCATQGVIAVSTNGTSITSTPVNTGNGFFAIAANGSGRVVAVGFSGRSAWSNDNGATWTQPNNFPATGSAIIWDGTRFVAAGSDNRIYTSTDGTAWTAGALIGAMSGGANGLTLFSGLYIAIGNTGQIYSSPDLATWTARTSGTTNNFNKIASGGGKVLIVGDGGTRSVSIDGTTYTTTIGGLTTAALYAASYGGGFYVMAGASVAYYSTDASAWTAISLSGTLRAAAFGDGAMMLAGLNGAGSHAVISRATIFNFNPATEFVTPAIAGGAGAIAYQRATA